VHASLVHAIALRETASAAVDVPMTIEALFSTYAGFVWRTLRHFGVAPVDLEDQTQEVFLVAHRRLAQWDGQQARPWLYGIARRCAAAYRRRGHRIHERPVETLPESTDARDFSERAEVAFLMRVLQSLDEDKRSVFLLYEVEEMSMREVAEAVQCPLQTAYTRLYAARRDIARALEEAK
jgi:RNA polymerase sigma-70 factor, ECF subfamily